MGDFLLNTFQTFYFYSDNQIHYTIPYEATTLHDFLGMNLQKETILYSIRKKKIKKSFGDLQKHRMAEQERNKYESAVHTTYEYIE